VQILRSILEENELREPIHATVDGDEYPPRVYFTEYMADSLNILVIYWYVPPDYWDYLEHAQRVNLRIFEEFEKAGIEFAFPTQTVYLAHDAKRALAIKMLGEDLPPAGT
jgi:MscS family membrane protein